MGRFKGCGAAGLWTNELVQLRSAWLLLLTTLLFLSALNVTIASHAPPPLSGRDALYVTGFRPQVASSPTPGLTISLASAVPSICPNDATTCSAGVGDSLVTLVAKANSTGIRAWPAVTLVFVIETSPYDGAYDPTANDTGHDPCALNNPFPTSLCDESNGVPIVAERAGLIAEDIAHAHPGTKFTFGMVDYFATHDKWDDGDGSEYHVDVGQPVPASQFGKAVNDTFVNQTLGGHAYMPGSGLSDNILDSSSITALYGVIAGVGITWPTDTHHVIVWMGSTTPRDPNYVEDYCPSPSSHISGNVSCESGLDSKYLAPTCEPSYAFGTSGTVSPNCEGWVVPHNGAAGDSIADFSRTGTNCVNSLGGNCTIDALDLATGLDVASSGGWGMNWQSGSIADHDAQNITSAGCDIALATGGVWVGPGGFFACNNYSGGVINPVRFGSYDDPDLNNTWLMAALTNVGLGSPREMVSAFGGVNPIFTFAPIGNIVVDPDLATYATCGTPNGTWASCQVSPHILQVGGTSVLQWNWSVDPRLNAIDVGDVWTAYIRVMATGPPLNTPVPIDACITVACFDYGSQEVGGFFTSANYFEPVVNVTQDASFPLALITVVGQPPNSGGTSPPSPPPSGGILPPVPAPSPVAPPVVQPAPVLLTVVAGGISVQAGVAGLLAAGFARVVIQPRAVSMKIGVKSGALTSKFDSKAQASSDKLGRFE